MRTRQLVTPVLWSAVVLVAGTVEFFRGCLRLAAMRPKGVFAVVTLAVLWRSSGLLAEQFPVDRVRPLGYGIGTWGTLAVGILVAEFGLRSRLRRRLWRKLARRWRLGW